MGFADEVAEAAKPARAPCSVSLALDKLDDDTRTEAVDVLASDAPGVAIAKVLSAHSGIELSGSTVQRHRRGICRCDLH